MKTDTQDPTSLVEKLALLTPQEVVGFAIQAYSPAVAIAFSGAEDVVLIDMAVKLCRPFRVFCLDTGRLHAETYRFLEQVRQRYRIDLEVFFPKPEAVESLVREKGLFSFYRDGHAECCNIRKVEPLRRAVAPAQAWITGQRRDQNPATRAGLPIVEIDPTFRGNGHPLLKFNPLANWSSREVWAYIRKHDVPYNPLHNAGFVSIGCEPCTRPIGAGQHEREGRWWWENAAEKECGLHGGNLKSSALSRELSAVSSQPSDVS